MIEKPTENPNETMARLLADDIRYKRDVRRQQSRDMDWWADKLGTLSGASFSIALAQLVMPFFDETLPVMDKQIAGALIICSAVFLSACIIIKATLIGKGD